MSIYYDQEGDYLEISIEGQSPAYGEDMGDDITLFKREDNGEIVGVGILNFRERAKMPSDIKLNLPFKINFSALRF